MTRTKKAVVLFSAGIVSLTLLLVAVSSQPSRLSRPPGLSGFSREAPCRWYQLVCQTERKARDAKNRGEEPCWWYKVGCEARVAAKRAERRRRLWEYEMLDLQKQQVEDARKAERQRQLQAELEKTEREHARATEAIDREYEADRRARELADLLRRDR